MEEQTTHTCPNCGFRGSVRFCPDCGQPQREARVSLGQWLIELMGEFSLTARLPKTLWALLARPGFLYGEWRRGRRTSYVSALRLYLLSSVIFFSVTFFLGLPFGEGLDLSLEDIRPTVQGSAREMTNLVVARRMQGFLTLGALISVPLIAFWLKLLRHRAGMLFVDHLVFSLYLVSAALLAFTVAYAALFFPPAGPWIAAALFTYVVAYWAVAWWRTYRMEGRRLRSVWRLAVATGGLGFIVLGLQIGEIAIAGTMLDSPLNVSNTEVGGGAYVAARSAYYAADYERARHLADLSIQSFSRVDADRLLDHVPFHVAEAHRFAGRHAEALTRAEALIEQDSTDLLSVGLAGVSAQEIGDTAAARAYYESLLDRFVGEPEDRESHQPAYGRYLFSARVFLGRATPGDLAEVARRAYRSATVAAAEGDDADARRWAAEAITRFGAEGVELGEHDPFHIAEMWHLLAEPDSARAALSPLLAVDTTHVLEVGFAGALSEAGGDTTGARVLYTRMLDALEAGAEPRSGHAELWERILHDARRATGSTVPP